MDSRNNFSLATTEGNISRGTPFTLISDTSIQAHITILSQPNVVFGGRAEKLQTLSVTCRLTP
jgi:hypothetical protein